MLGSSWGLICLCVFSFFLLGRALQGPNKLVPGPKKLFQRPPNTFLGGSFGASKSFCFVVSTTHRRLAGRLAGRPAGRLAGWVAGWLPGCLVDRLAGWLALWLDGGLAW